METQTLLTVKDVARILNLKPMTVYRMIERKVIKSVKIGSAVRVSQEEIDQIIKGGGK